MTVVRFVPVALALILAGAAAWLLLAGHLVLGVIVAVLAVGYVGLLVWARAAGRQGEERARPYVEHSRELW